MLKTITQHRVVSGLCIASLAFVVGGFAWVYTAFSNAGVGPFILHFNDMNGVTQIGGLGSIVAIGIFSTLIVLMNFAVATVFDERDPFLGKFLAGVTLLLAVLLFIGCASIVGVN